MKINKFLFLLISSFCHFCVCFCWLIVLIMGRIFLLLCMFNKFVLDARHCECYTARCLAFYFFKGVQFSFGRQLCNLQIPSIFSEFYFKLFQCGSSLSIKRSSLNAPSAQYLATLAGWNSSLFQASVISGNCSVYCFLMVHMLLISIFKWTPLPILGAFFVWVLPLLYSSLQIIATSTSLNFNISLLNSVRPLCSAGFTSPVLCLGKHLTTESREDLRACVICFSRLHSVQ